jgi:outer membrane receptor protein involved in Fe transport
LDAALALGIDFVMDGDGVSSVSLRGLGSNRTLLLVNGQRLLSGDPNAIPADAVERIEVLPAGASAIYGSDAMAGVVNFILRKNYDGATFTVNAGQSSNKDGDQKGYTFTFGHTTEKGSIMAGINYQKQDGVLSARRSFSQDALSLSSGSVFGGGSSSGPNGRIQLPSDLAAQFGCGTVALTPGGNSQVVSTANYHCFGNSDRYNYAAINLVMTPQERSGGFIFGDYQLTDHVSAYVDAIFQNTSASFQLAPALFGTDTTGGSISADNAFNPFGVDFNASSGNSFRSRLVVNGPRFASTGRTDAQVNTGLRGDFTVGERIWNWDVGFNYGNSTSVVTTGGLVDQTVLYTGPSTMGAGGVAICPPGISSVACQFNPFNPGTPASLEAIKQANVIAPSNSYQIEKTWHASIAGDLFTLPAGNVQLAVGVEDRTVYQHTIPAGQLLIDPNTGSCTLGSQCISAVQGGYGTKEIYAEAFIPLLADKPGAKALNLILGDRYSRLESFGNNNSFKVALEWKPIDDLLIRGTVQGIFRAPNLGELYNSGSDAPMIGKDPCDGYTGQASLAQVCQYVPTDGSFVNQQTAATGQQASTITGGARVAGFPIKPENGKSYNLGFVYSPAALPGFSTTVDFWRVNINDTITSVGIQSLLNLCATGNTVYCQYIHRVPTGVNAGQLLPTTMEPTGNLGSLSVSGIDWSANYKLPEFSIGQFNVGLNATYLKDYIQNTAPGTDGNATYSDAGLFLRFGSDEAAACPDAAGVCTFPRVRAQGFVDWKQNNWNAQLRMRWISGFTGHYMDAADMDNDIDTTIKYGGTFYSDISAGYNLESFKTRFDIGVNNISNKQPPMLYANNTLNANTDPSTFDMMGRYYWARITVKF